MKPRRVLVLQLCRMGDILQTTPMLRGIRREHPDWHVTLVLLDGFASVPIPTRLYDRLVSFPHSALFATVATNPDQWRDGLTRLRSLIEELGSEPYDLALNLTHSDVSGYLMAAVPSRERRGVVFGADRKRAIRGAWMQYFWATARSRLLRAFNLVDLYTWSADVGCDDGALDLAVPDPARHRIEEWLNEHKAGVRPLIALQLGASEQIRQWRPENFAGLVDQLPADVADFVLVGTAGERPLADRFKAVVRRPVLDAVGSTSLTELGALLGRCRLLVTNDTGTMHVATAVGTKVLEITLGPALAHETGPYGVGHLIVEPEIACFPCPAGADCNHRSCHEYLSPGAGAALVRFAMGEPGVPTVPGGRVLCAVRAASGGVEYRPLVASTMKPTDILRDLTGQAWGDSLGFPHPAAGVQAPKRDLLPSGLTDWAWATPVIKALAEVETEARNAGALLRRLPGAPRKEQADLAARTHRHLERLLLLGEIEPSCLPLVTGLRVELESIVASDLRTLTRTQTAAYLAVSGRAIRLASLLSACAPAPSCATMSAGI
ncbi:MAG TPA: glycosyltransferase family 9 protein [Vicinamibacterales bacterium]